MEVELEPRSRSHVFQKVERKNSKQQNQLDMYLVQGNAAKEVSFLQLKADKTGAVFPTLSSYISEEPHQAWLSSSKFGVISVFYQVVLSYFDKCLVLHRSQALSDFNIRSFSSLSSTPSHIRKPIFLRLGRNNFNKAGVSKPLLYSTIRKELRRFGWGTNEVGPMISFLPSFLVFILVF